MSEETERKREWDDIYSIKSGKVITVEKTHPAYGNYVEVKDKKGVTVRYAHLESTAVNVGDEVEAGDYLGQMGNTGNSTGKHVHIQVFTAETKASSDIFYEQNIDPIEYIRDGGVSPCNTRMSGNYGQMYSPDKQLPSLEGKENLKQYLHEGLDGSGNINNIYPGWEYGIDVNEVLEGYPSLYADNLERKRKAESDYEREIARLNNISDKHFLVEGLSDDEVADLRQKYIDAVSVKIKNKYESYLNDYSEIQGTQTNTIGENIETQLRTRETQINTYLNVVRQSGVSKTYDEKYNTLLRDKPSVFGNKVVINELEGNLRSRLQNALVEKEHKNLVDEKIDYLRKKVFKTSDFYDLIIVDDENLRKAILGEISISEYESLLAEQQRLEQEASTTTTNTTPTETTVATETSNEQEQTQTQTSEDGTSGDTQNQTGGGSTDEQGSGNGETSNNQTQNDGGSDEQSNPSTDETEDETTYWDTFEDEEEETETTETPTEDEGGSGEIVLEGENEITEGNTEDGEGSSDESPIIVGGTTGGSSGGNTGNNQGGSSSGGSPGTGGGSGGGGGGGPRYETEMPDAWATSITPNKPQLPEGMYLGRHAGINVRNYYFDWLGDSEETSITRIFDENTFESDYFEAGGVSTSEALQQIKLVSSVALSATPSELEECDIHG